MKEILEQLFQHKSLSRQEAKEAVIGIASDKFNPNQIASFLTAYLMRSITLEELKGFREGLLELCQKVDLSAFNPMDVCGTGGDSKNTFNISTITAFVIASCGVPVAKHGNYGVTSVSGSSNVLEYLGVIFHTDIDIIKKQIETSNICFLHAPMFHSSLYNVAPIRKNLGVKTFFNMVGPLVNPAQPKIQLSGVFNLELARMYQYLFQEEMVRFGIVHSIDGYDEISLTGNCKLYSHEGERILTPDYFSCAPLKPFELFGGNSVKEAAEIFMNIISAKGTNAQNKVITANAAIALKTYYENICMDEAIHRAEEALLGKKVLKTFNQFKELT